MPSEPQVEGFTRAESEVIAWARKAGIPLMNPPRVPEAAAAMCQEIERLRQEHAEFVEGLTAALNAHGVPACSSWRTAIDYLAYHGGRERNV